MKSLVLMLTAAALGAGLSSSGDALACTVCGLDSEPGFLWSMSFLISMPFAILAVAGGYFAFTSRREQSALEREENFPEQ